MAALVLDDRLLHFELTKLVFIKLNESFLICDKCRRLKSLNFYINLKSTTGIFLKLSILYVFGWPDWPNFRLLFQKLGKILIKLTSLTLRTVISINYIKIIKGCEKQKRLLRATKCFYVSAMKKIPKTQLLKKLASWNFWRNFWNFSFD